MLIFVTIKNNNVCWQNLGFEIFVFSDFFPILFYCEAHLPSYYPIMLLQLNFYLKYTIIILQFLCWLNTRRKCKKVVIKSKTNSATSYFFLLISFQVTTSFHKTTHKCSHPWNSKLVENSFQDIYFLPYTTGNVSNKCLEMQLLFSVNEQVFCC